MKGRTLLAIGPLALLAVASFPRAQSARAAPRGAAGGSLPERSIDLGELPTGPPPGTVRSQSKVGVDVGWIPDLLDADDALSSAVTSLGDLDGDGRTEVAVGAPGGAGAVWILSLDSDGAPQAHRKIDAPPSTGFGGAGFGSAVVSIGDLDGDGVADLVVGAPDTDGPSESDRGAVWILFLAFDGTVASYRAIGHAQGGFGDELERFDRFGAAVTALGDIDGDGVGDIAVGAPGPRSLPSGQGAVWVLRLNTDGTVKAYQEIGLGRGGFGGALGASDSFGCSLAAWDDIDGNGVRDIAVGAQHSDVLRINTGALWLLRLAPDGTVLGQERIAGLEVGDRIGTSVAALGDLDGDGGGDLAVGSRRGTGTVFVMFFGPSGVLETFREIGEGVGGFTGDLREDDAFAGSLAALGDIDGDHVDEVVVGAPGDDDGGADHGALWLLSIEADGSVTSQRKVTDTELPFASTLDSGDDFGGSVAALGDFDGDGIGDFAVGAPRSTGAGGRETGAVWLLFPGPDGSVERFRKVNDVLGGFTGLLDANGRFGGATAAMGDLDGDGVGDLAVGAPQGGGGGSVWFLLMRSDGTVKGQQQIGRQQLPSAEDRVGSALASLGDLDGNGTSDLAVGAAGQSNNFGSVVVLFLGPGGTLQSHTTIGYQQGGFTADLDQGDAFGSSIAVLGDLDGDGVDELAVGAPGDDRIENLGAVWILFLRADGTVRSQQKIARDRGGFVGELDVDDAFGSSVAAPGDWNGDGVADLVVGAPGDDDGGTDVGAFWVLFLRPNGAVESHRKISATEGGFAGSLRNQDLFGQSVASQDLDADGVRDLVAGIRDMPSAAGALWLLTVHGVATLGFETGDDGAHARLVNGQSVSAAGPFGRAVQVASSGANLGATLFDSSPLGPNATSLDPDLLVDRGNVLILQDSRAPAQTVPGVFDRPDDAQDGGTLSFVFEHGPVLPLSLDLIDLDPSYEYVTTVTLVDTAGHRRVHTVHAGWTEDLVLDGPRGWRTVDLTERAVQPGYVGPATVLEFPGFDASAVTRIEVHLPSSGAVDGLRWLPHSGPSDDLPRQ